MKKDMYELFKEHEVKCDSLEDFLSKYTKPSRHAERGEEYVEIRIKSHQEDLNRYGYTIISHHDSITGKVVSYYGTKKKLI